MNIIRKLHPPKISHYTVSHNYQSYVFPLLQNADTITDLQEKVRRTIQHAVEVEEKIPLDQVTNYDEVM